MRFFLLLLLCLISVVGFSQEMLNVDVLTKDFKTDKKDGGVTIKVYDGASLVGTYTSPANGKVVFQVPVGKVYKVEASKAGKVTRYINVNAKGITTELLPANTSPTATFSLGLFEQAPGVDYSYVTSNPATEFYFDGSNPALQYDGVVADRMSKKIEKLLKDADAAAGQSEAAYNAAIKKADAFYNQKKYEEALVEYEAALKIKPTEPHPNQRLMEIDGILKAQKANAQQSAEIDQAYQGLISAADALFNQKKYEEAIKRYEEALTKKQEQYPKDQIAKANAEITKQKNEAANAAKYKEVIEAGDMFMKQKSFTTAKAKYTEALKYKADDPYATGKLKEIEGELQKQKADTELKKQYDAAIAAGDALFAEEKWAEAKVKYQEALKIQSSSAYAQGRITDIDAKLAALQQQKAKEELINKLLAEGNTAFTASQWVAAKAKYEEVLKQDPNNATAAGRIKDIEAKIAAEKASAENLAKIKQLIADGDALAKANKLEEAKAKYQQALDLKPDGAVQAKIDAINQQIAAAGAKAEQKAKYDKAMADGEALFASASYEQAKAKFKEAQDLDPAQALPKQRIIDTDKKIAEAAANAQKNEKFQAAMNAGNAALAAKNLTEAKAKFQDAINIDGSKTEAKTKLAEVESLIAADLKTKENQAKYDAAIKAGADALAANKLTEAKAKYQQAALLDPSKPEPNQKIAEIDRLIAQAETQTKIAGLLTEGNAALGKKDLATARAKYQQVMTLDPSNAEASSKLQEIARLEKDAASEAQNEARFKQLKEDATNEMSKGNYQMAKQKLIEAKTIKADPSIDQLIAQCEVKIAEQAKGAEADKQYQALLAEAQGLESGKQYDQAIEKYNAASKIKPNETLPKERIAAINQIKSNNANQAKIDADYAALMKKGDEAFQTQDYLKAIQFYNQALGVKPNEKAPVEKAAEAERLEREKGNDFLVQYQKVLSVAQKAMDEKNYTKAQELYKRATNMNADDQLPKDKLAEIDRILKADKDAQEKLAAYNKKMSEAEAAATSGKLENAITLFQQAKTIRPDETQPDKRIAEIRSQIDAGNAAAGETEKRYLALMAEGNTAAAGQDYEGALAKYEAALAVKQNDKDAQTKASEMRQLLDDRAKAAAKSGEIQKLLTKADAEFANSKWQVAKDIYESVLKIDGSNKYATEQIRLCNTNLKKESADEVEINYQKIIAKGDENFDKKDYDRAIDYYKRASKLKSGDPYPKKRLEEIDAILNPKPVVNNQPQPLTALGDPNNSLSDQALQKAETERKKRKFFRFQRKLDEAAALTDSLAAQQYGDAKETDQSITAIKKENEQQGVNEEESHQEVVNAIDTEQEKVIESINEANQYETAENLDAKAQLNLAVQQAEEENSVLDGAPLENAEVLKKNNVEMQDAQAEVGKSEYEEYMQNEQGFKQVRIDIEQVDLDDTDSRQQMEEMIKQASDGVDVVTAENQVRTDQNLEAVKAKINDTDAQRAEEDYEKSKRGGLNNEEMKLIEDEHAELNAQDHEREVETSLEIRNSIEETNQVISEEAIKDVESATETAQIMEDQARSQEEYDRENYNAMVVKSMTNDQQIQQEVIRQSETAQESSQKPSENAEIIKQIHTDRADTDAEAALGQEEKHLTTKQIINEATHKVGEDAQQGSAIATNNEQAIKGTKNELNTADQQQIDAQDAKTQDNRQMIAAIEKREVVFNEKVANEIGKLYPEGVSQEQFEQNDKEGLLEAVVTRRIVVKNGYGSVYVRTQTLGAITYSKNGQATTETVWQRETQDAALIRNY